MQQENNKDYINKAQVNTRKLWDVLFDISIWLEMARQAIADNEELWNMPAEEMGIYQTAGHNREYIALEFIWKCIKEIESIEQPEEYINNIQEKLKQLKIDMGMHESKEGARVC